MDGLATSLKRLLRDRRSGSSVIASRFCRLCLADMRESKAGIDPARLKRGMEALIKSFPTMALLYTLRDRLRKAVQDGAHCSSDIQQHHLVDLFPSFLGELEDCRRQAALHFAGVAGRHKSFLTLSASGAVLEACAVLHDHLSRARRRRPGPTVIVCESRPAREGIAMARRLHKAGCTVTLIADAAMGHWIEEVDAVLLGADWIDRKGFINKTGSLALSKLALFQRKPVYVIGDTLRIRKEIFPALGLPKADPTEVLKRPESGLTVENRYFERVPWNASHVLVTERHPPATAGRREEAPGDTVFSPEHAWLESSKPENPATGRGSPHADARKEQVSGVVTRSRSVAVARPRTHKRPDRRHPSHQRRRDC